MKYCNLSDVAEIKICTVSPGRTKTGERPTHWLTGANFLKDNTITYDVVEMFYSPDETMRVRNGDTIVKRISPVFVNYIDSVPDEIYAGSNLIIVSPKTDVYPKYMAALLSDKIRALSKSGSGAVTKFIDRNHLEEMKIPIMSYEKQVVVGELWYENIELKKMKTLLAELESKKRNRQISEYVNTHGEN